MSSSLENKVPAPAATPAVAPVATETPADSTKAKAALTSLLEKIKKGEAPSGPELSLYRALRDIQESKDPEVQAKARELLNKQIKEIKGVDLAKDTELQTILDNTTTAIEDIRKNAEAKIGGQLGGVVSQIFEYSGSFQETTGYDEFLDMLRAITVMSKGGKTVPTKANWKEAGHDGQHWFDEAELEEINAFYKYINENPSMLKRVEQLSRAKTGRELMVGLLKVTDARYVADRDIKVSKVTATDKVGVSKMETAEGKYDAVDVLFEGSSLWSVNQARDILKGGDTKAKVALAYKNVTNQELNFAELAKHPELAVEFQKMLAQQIQLLSLLSKTELALAGGKKLEGNTGLTTILRGKFESTTERMAEKITYALETNKTKALPSVETPEGRDLLALATRFGLPIIVSLMTQGMAIASYENRNITSKKAFDDISARYGENVGIMNLVHDAFLGKTLSFRFGENHAIENYLKDVQGAVAKFDAQAKVSFNETGLESTEDKNFYSQIRLQYDLMVKGGMDPEQAQGVLRNSLFKMIQIDAAKRANNNDWSFRLGLLFIGVANEGIATNSKYVKNAELSTAATEGKKLTRKEIDEKGIEFIAPTAENRNYRVRFAGQQNFGELPEGVTRTEEDGKVVLTSDTPIGLSHLKHRGSDNTVEDIVLVKKLAAAAPAKVAATTKSIESAVSPQDKAIHGMVRSAFQHYETSDRQRGNFVGFQNELVQLISGKDTKLKLANISKPSLRKDISDMLAGDGFKKLTAEEKTLVYASMLAETAGDNRMVQLAKSKDHKLSGKRTLQSLRGDAWGHAESSGRRVREWGVKDAGNLAQVRKSVHDGIAKERGFQSERVDGVLAFSVFSQINTAHGNKVAFRGVPFVGTNLNLVQGNRQKFESADMRQKMVSQMPASVVDAFAKQLGTPFTSENLKELLAQPGMAINATTGKVEIATSALENEQITLSSDLMFAMYEKCLNDVYYFANMKVKRPGVPEQNVVPPAVEPNMEILEGDSLHEEMVESIDTALGINPIAVWQRKQEVETKNTVHETNITTRPVTVSPSNIRDVNGVQTILVQSGGNNMHIALTSLSRDQLRDIRAGKEIILNLPMSVDVVKTITTITTTGSEVVRNFSEIGAWLTGLAAALPAKKSDSTPPTEKTTDAN